MTHAELYSTSEPGASPAPRKTSRKRLFAVLALASAIGAASAVISTTRPASADQISDAKAEAAAITAKLQAIQGQEQSLSGQVQSADYRLSQLQGQIAANQAEVAKDQAEVAKDQGQLRVQAISDYTSSGTTNQVTQMFSSDVDTSDIRSEYSSIAAGNVTTTIDQLHTAQAQLQATQSALQQQTSQATATRNGLQSSESQAADLAGQYQGTLNSVNANIQQLVAQQQAAQAAAAKAAATAAFNAKLAAAQKAQAAAQATVTSASGSGSTGSASSGSSGGGNSAPVAASSPPPVPSGVGGAIQAAESQLGVPYVWGGETPGVGFDCSGLVQWSYAQAGIGLPRTSGAQYAATVHIPLADIEPGDLLFYGADGSEHVAMYIGGGSMIEAPYTGATVHVTGVRTGDGFAGVGRVG
jgi:cell wall-associated NlpC family hydrolase